MIHLPRWLTTYLIASMVTFLMFVTAAEEAISGSLPHLTVTQSGDFHSALTALAEQGHVAFVAEGVPLHPHLSPLDAAKLTIPSGLDAEVKAVADTYDYTTQRDGNVLVLKKRYTNPDDLPMLTQGECEHTLEQIGQVVEPFNPHTPPERIQFLAPPNSHLRRDQYRVTNPLVDPLVASLTPDQLAIMHQNKLPVSALSKDQQATAWRLLLSLDIKEPMRVASMMLPKIQQSEKSATFEWKDVTPSQHVFGYTLSQSLPGTVVPTFHPLTASDGLEDLNITVISPSDVSPANADADPTMPLPDMTPADPSSAKTLTEVINAVNAWSSIKMRVDVDAAVAAKLVTVAGLNNAPAEYIFRALAEVYGLSLTNGTPGNKEQLTLGLPDVEPTSDPVTLSSSLRQTLPEPLRRAMHLDRMITAEQQFQSLLQSPHNQSMSAQTPRASNSSVEETSAGLERAMLDRKHALDVPEHFQTDQNQINQAEATLHLLRVTAIRRLRTLTEPRLKEQPSGVPLSTLGEAGHETLATIFLLEATQAIIKNLTHPVPDAVMHFDRVVLGGGVYGDPQHPMFSVYFNSLAPDGHLMPGGGIAGLDYNK